MAKALIFAMVIFKRTENKDSVFMMQLTLMTKMKIGLYVVKNMLTKPTFNKFNPNDNIEFYAHPNVMNDDLRRKSREVLSRVLAEETTAHEKCDSELYLSVRYG